MSDELARIEKAIDIAFCYGCTDGGHHKMWVIDQMVRALCGDQAIYKELTRGYEEGVDGEHTYEWETGIAP